MFPLGILKKKTADPNLTLALLHFEGANGATSFVDSSPLGVTYTTGWGNLSRTAPLFGTSSWLSPDTMYSRFSYTEPYYDNEFPFDLTNSDFTMEGFIRPTGAFTTDRVYGICSTSNSGGSSASTLPASMCFVNGVLYGQIQLESDGILQYISHQNTISINNTYHVALERYNGVVTLYLNGVPSTSTLSVGTSVLKTGNTSSTSIRTFAVGGRAQRVLSGETYSFSGKYDEFRLRKEAMYKCAFTPPSSAFTF